MSSNIIFGFHTVEAYLTSSTDAVLKVYINNTRKDKRINNTINLCKQHNLTIEYVDHKKLDSLSQDGNHQGVVAEVTTATKPIFSSIKELLKELPNKEDSIIIALDGITDPHNLGAIIRSAECFGVDAIILPKDNSANANNSTVEKTSCGATKLIPILNVTNLNQALDTLKENEYWVIGTSLADSSKSLFEFEFKGKMAIVMGNEEKGIRRLIQENCDFLVNIPMSGQTQSLNVSVATGVILAHSRFIQQKQINN